MPYITVGWSTGTKRSLVSVDRHLLIKILPSGALRKDEDQFGLFVWTMSARCSSLIASILAAVTNVKFNEVTLSRCGLVMQ